MPKNRKKVGVLFVFPTTGKRYNLIMRYKYFNPNPIKDTASDCVVRMLCKVTGRPWAENYLDLVEKGLEVGDVPSANSVWLALLRDMGFKRYVIPDTCPDCYTIEDFAIDHPNGVYVLGTGSHVVCVKDGFYWDSWQSGDEVPLFFLSR